MIKDNVTENATLKWRKAPKIAGNLEIRGRWGVKFGRETAGVGSRRGSGRARRRHRQTSLVVPPMWVPDVFGCSLWGPNVR
jgi:hypothetical protein